MAARAPVRLQDGVYFRKGESPPRAYRLVLLRIAEGTSRPQVREALVTMWAMLGRLRAGVVDLNGPGATALDAHVDAGALTCLLGFGAPLFGRYRELAKPAGVDRLGELPFNSLRWAAADRRTGEGDVAIQLIATSELAVDRAVVEIWMWTSSATVPLKVVNV